MSRQRRASATFARRAAGVTLVEMAVVVSIVGLLGVLATSGYADYAGVRARARAQADAELARQAIRSFALRHKRLPCPDTTSTGSGAREGTGGVCAASAQVGWLPYESLGLAAPEPRARMRYAVSRAAGVDLVAPTAITGVDTDFDGGSRLHAALAATARLARGTSRPYLTGAGSPASPENCAVVQSNPAFAVVAPVADRDDAPGTHAGFDGVNRDMASAARLCIAAPSRPMDSDYDDVVVADSATALLGWLAAHTR